MDATQSAERWLPVVGFEGWYEVSDHGRVRSLDRDTVNRCGQHRHRRGQLLRLRHSNKTGHLSVYLSKDDASPQKRYIHRLMLEAFVGPCPNEMECRHVNDISDDNRLGNLSWGTRKDNMCDIVSNGNHNNAKKTHCPYGHEYDEKRVRNGRIHRWCRECSRRRAREYLRRKRTMA